MPAEHASETRVSVFSRLFKKDKTVLTNNVGVRWEITVEDAGKNRHGEPWACLKVNRYLKTERVETLIFENIFPDDAVSLKHDFSAAFEDDVSDNLIFPIEIKFKGQHYFLRRTRQDKLILTK